MDGLSGEFRMRQRNITFGISDESGSGGIGGGIVFSRVGSEVAFNITGKFEKMSIYSPGLSSTYWTKKVPVAIKNQHRKFWGFPLLSGSNIIPKNGFVLYAKGTFRMPSKLIVEVYNEEKAKMMLEKGFDVVQFFG